MKEQIISITANDDADDTRKAANKDERNDDTCGQIKQADPIVIFVKVAGYLK